ncbi:MAG TPA: hypothetical protein VFM70_05565 [Salinimicrobium sp.]|nr:hypothetical protein [Salinimicrobium sp.]
MNSNVNLVRTVLKFTYGLVPIVAGLDKFTYLLTDWSQYVSDGFASMLPFDPESFMMIVGIIEIVAGILVLTKPKIGAWVVMAWLIAIALSLIFGGHHYDTAVRDLVMAIGAFSLAKLSENEEKHEIAM